MSQVWLCDSTSLLLSLILRNNRISKEEEEEENRRKGHLSCFSLLLLFQSHNTTLNLTLGNCQSSSYTYHHYPHTLHRHHHLLLRSCFHHRPPYNVTSSPFPLHKACQPPPSLSSPLHLHHYAPHSALPLTIHQTPCHAPS